MREKGREVASTTEERERDRERERWGPHHKRIRDASMAA